MTQIKNKNYRNTYLLIILSHLIPLYGVLFWGWRIIEIFMVYWLESALIGLIYFIKIWRVKGSPMIYGLLATLIYLPFFIAFMYVHLSVMLNLLLSAYGITSDSPLSYVPLIFSHIYPAIVGLIVRYGLSYFVNFRHPVPMSHLEFKKETRNVFGRVFIIQITIVAGAFFAVTLLQPMALLMVFILVKVIAELKYISTQSNTP